jgi:hypothetical protein
MSTRRRSLPGQIAGSRVVLTLAVLVPAFFHLACAQPSSVNFSHLQHLTETISLKGGNVDIVHVYANYPDYRWFEAADAGTEGVACVDDAARAAVLYLRHYELSGEQRSLDRAKALLEFVLKMQSDDGEFCNFLYSDHSINTTGRTSVKSFGWWASRGVWSLGTGYRVLKNIDPLFAGTLKRALDRSLPRVNDLLVRYGKCDTVAGFPVPRWLPYESGADVTSELLLGLVDFYAAAPDTNLRFTIERLAGGIMMMQSGTPQQAPFGLHRSWETQWHMWGNSQTQALAAAGKVLEKNVFVASAEREAGGFYARLLIDGFSKEWNLASAEPPSRYEQIAYAVRPMAVGLIRLYEATGKNDYLVMAGLAGSWLSGNNVLKQPIYDPATGRCFDGIRDSVTINKNSGAESTIEALYSLVEIEQYPAARRFLSYRKIFSGKKGEYKLACFQNDRGEEVTLRIDGRDGIMSILDGEASKRFREQYQ